MGPNLTRLFAEKRNQADCDEARDLIAEMFDTHGEALIAALDVLMSNHHTPETYGKAMDTAKRLLAQLESEAKP